MSIKNMSLVGWQKQRFSKKRAKQFASFVHKLKQGGHITQAKDLFGQKTEGTIDVRSRGRRVTGLSRADWCVTRHLLVAASLVQTLSTATSIRTANLMWHCVCCRKKTQNRYTIVPAPLGIEPNTTIMLTATNTRTANLKWQCVLCREFLLIGVFTFRKRVAKLFEIRKEDP